jgi:hypothetical protein
MHALEKSPPAGFRKSQLPLELVIGNAGGRLFREISYFRFKKIRYRQ